MSHTAMPVFFRLLADRKLAPGATLLSFADTAPQALQLLADAPEFAEFAQSFDCLLDANQAAALPPELLEHLHTAGVKVAEARLFCHSDAPTKPVLPATATWLDGRWMLVPPQRQSGAQSASRALALKLLQLVMTDAETRDIEAVLRQDPALSYHLLRLVNSLGMGMTRHITSFAQAIMILGRLQLRRWLNLMLFASRSDDYRAPMLLAKVALRARRMELLAKEMGLDRADQDLAFMTGMFSMLDVLFGTPLPELIRPLQLGDELVAALIEHQGDIGRLLALQLCADQCDAPAATAPLAALHLTPAQFTLATLGACQWMLHIVHDAKGAGHAG